MSGEKNIQAVDEERRSDRRAPILIWAKEISEDMTSFHLVSNISHNELHIEKKLPVTLDQKN